MALEDVEVNVKMVEKRKTIAKNNVKKKDES